MSNIKVPYMPISEFEISDEFLKEFDNLNDENPVLQLDAVGDACQDITVILQTMGMEKYATKFRDNRVQIDTFLNLNEADLIELGVTDQKDREKILKNLCTVDQTVEGDFIVEEDHLDDLQIVKNVSHQVALLQNYAAYIELQMKKYELTGYRVESKDLASAYLKAFTESALIQSQIMSTKIYEETSDNGLIDKILKMYNLFLPPIHSQLLPKKSSVKKGKGSSTVMKVITVSSLIAVLIAVGKYLMR